MKHLYEVFLSPGGDAYFIHSILSLCQAGTKQFSSTPGQREQTSKSLGASRPRRATTWAETHNTERRADGWEEVVAAQREAAIRRLPECRSPAEWSASPAREGRKDMASPWRKKQHSGIRALLFVKLLTPHLPVP